MTYQLTAEDVGFITDQDKVESAGRIVTSRLYIEKVIIDGFHFPKFIPSPIFTNEKNAFFTRYQSYSPD